LVFICVFLVLMVLAVFGQTRGFGFVDYDDQQYVSENRVVRMGLTWKGALWALTYGGIGHWHPLTWLSHMADCQMYGLWAGGHHLSNVALHALNAVLLFLVLRAMTGSLWRSAFVAAVFAVHPLRAESVAWIAERKDVLSGTFFMLTLWAYVRYARASSRRRYVVVAVLFALGLLSKNMLVTLPFVLLLLDWWPLGRMKPADAEDSRGPRIRFLNLVWEKIPLFLLSIGSCVATALVPESVGRIEHVAALERVGNALVSYVIYLRQMVFPVGLAIPYPFQAGGIPIWEVLVALVTLAAITAGMLACRQKRPYLLIGWLWYLGMLVPVIGLVQISYYARADRYTYLPGIGLALAATWAVADWSVKWKDRQAVLGCLMIVILGTLMVWGRTQTSYWRDSESLWNHTLAADPANTFARDSLGKALRQKGDLDGAIAQYRQVLSIKPDYATTRNNLGIALRQKGDLDGAIAQYRKALEIDPDFVDVRNNLGNALEIKGDLEGAMAQYQSVLEIHPDSEPAHNNLGNILFMKGDVNGAIAHYLKALGINPDYVEAHCDLGAAYLQIGKVDEAAAQYRRTLEINPSYAKARYGLGKALLRKGEFDGAMVCLERTTTLSPNPLARWYNLGNSFLQKNNLEEAMACYRQAIKMDPRAPDAYANLGLACLRKGETKEAIDSWQQALETKPDQPNIQNNLAWLLATTPDASLRNGAKAVALAEQAKQLTAGGNPMVLHTLAAAYAEAGRFGDATATARRALDLATAEKNGDLLAKLPKEIKLYEAGAPMRDVPQ
jgi:tetratricopeptide (TPR) repeat protein